MLNEKEQLFLNYWEANRLRERKIGFLLLAGLPVGLLFTIPIFLVLFSGRFWFKRADMVANSQMSPVLIVCAGFLIAFFIAVFHKYHQWEMKDQQYQELVARERKEKLH